MSSNENLFTKKAISELSGSPDGVAEARKVLWRFPTRDAGVRRGRELGQQIVAVAFAGDMLLILSALLLSFYIRFQTPIREWGINARPDVGSYLGYIILASVVYIGMLCYGGVYDHRNLLKLRLVTARILKWSVAWVGLILLASFMVKFEPPLSRVYCVMAWVITPSILVCWRSLFQLLLMRTSALAALQQRVVFVGWNEHSAHLAQNFIRSPGSGYQVIGYIHGHADERTEISIPYLGDIDEAERIISSVAIDILILADLDYDRQRILQLADSCEREMVEFKVVPSYFQILVSGLHLETVSGIPVLGVSRLPLDRIVNRAIKRGIDIVGGTVGLLLSMPIIFVFGTMVYLESPGPIFYRQRRSGRNGNLFDIIKIRSMRPDAEGDGKVGWTVQNDPRRLRIGAFMRKWNIDEVPQFWNVLRGEMSLVGPRPERPELVARFKHDIPHYNARHNAKPGITGWAQIHGLRGNTDLAERINYDVWYMENWSLILDFQIMFMTLFKNQNAA
ncbi:MAG TPA: exopolysaccharide biosynthesis polyprenyl glycosylphosphotransferase [Chthoniobacterales bacterium]|nr:exopolysaccharide biosynthesis polyprenyl glycosylphosphotransferase [Chthoniobacterales bacterium]